MHLHHSGPARKACGLSWPIVAAAIALFPMPAKAQFSPGPLSHAHRRLNGPTHCSDCHAVAAGTRKFKCLGCHGEIRQRLAAGRGLHPSLLGGNRSEQQCIKCHSEHNGENFVPIRWDVSREEFDHGKTGYPLEGAHRGLACEKCHSPEHIQPAARKGIVMTDLRRTYLGLARDCAGCHQDAHAGQLGPRCERCHAVTSWKDVTRFDHSEAKFKLAAAHQKVACAKCHKNIGEEKGGKAKVQFVGLAFERCTPCHNDPHRGAFAAPCQACHSEAAWKPARMVTSNFDHSKTHFPLLGRHAGLTCEKCHRGAGFKEPVTHLKCADCHRDMHNGQFLARADRGECGACHTVEGWKPTTFTVANHRGTSYPLEGRHASVVCEKCHVPRGAATLYRVKHTQCTDCHSDEHRGQFTAAPFNNRCEICHSVDGFQPSLFTLRQHTTSRFPLTGAHSAIPCTECHTRGAGYPPPPVRYHFADLSCAACHVDPHSGQFRERMALIASDGKPAGCEACHTTQTWRDVAKFNHEKTRFPLVGSHRGVACGQCHRASDFSVGMRAVVFGAAPRECSGCHEDVHGGQFSAGTGKADCAACHEVLKWRPAKFDHDRAAFRLTEAHKQVACRQCHTNKTQIDGRVVLLYKPTPQDCAGCHGPEISN